MKKVLLTIPVSLLLIPALVAAYLSPGPPDGFVNDFAGVLSAELEAELENNLAAYELQSGNQIAIVTIAELADETIETYAASLFQDWGIGKRGQDNGVLFLVSLADRKTRIEVGYGLEGELTDVESKQIVTNIVGPNFQQGNFDNGVQQTVLALINAIGGQETISASPADSKGANLDYGFLLWIGIFIFIWLGSILSRSRSWWLGGVLGAAGGVIIGLILTAWIWLPVLVVVGLGFDYLVSTKFKNAFTGGGGRHGHIWWFLGGGPHWWDKGGRGGGGFGGFGGGLSGGGGASGDW